MNFAVVLLLISLNVFADSWTADKPSHSTLYVDTLTSKTDASAVNIADSQGLFVTGDVTTLGRIGIGTTNPDSQLSITNTGGNANLKISSTPLIGNAQITLAQTFYPPTTGPTLTMVAHGGLTEAILGLDAREINLIYSTGGANNNGIFGIGTRDSNDLIFATNDAEKMRITSGGNVGIGTASPLKKFHVDGDFLVQTGGVNVSVMAGSGNLVIGAAKIEASSGFQALGSGRVSAGGPYSLTGGTYAWDIKSTNNGLEFIDVYDGTTSMMFNGNGNVGIGTTNPLSEFHLVTDYRTFRIGTASYTINDGTDTWGIGMDGDGFFISSANSVTDNPTTSRLWISDGTGNVGIGTTTPNHDQTAGNNRVLTIDPGIGQPRQSMIELLAHSENQNGGDRVGSLKFFNAGSNDGANHGKVAEIVALTDTNREGGRLDFRVHDETGTAGSLRDAVTIRATGNVGIGTTNPGGMLQVENLVWNKEASNNIDFSYNQENIGTKTLRVYGSGLGSALNLRLHDGALQVTTDDSSGNPSYIIGNLGIGTTSPARKLHISDAMRLEPIASPPSSPSSGDLYFDSSEALCVYVSGAWTRIAGGGTCT